MDSCKFVNTATNKTSAVVGECVRRCSPDKFSW
jgi:hypothetical protein